MTEKTEINVLGCGSSFGVPLSHNIWGNCDKSNPKNQRTRPSILLKKAGKSILIDTSPDLRKQLIDNKINNVDSVFTWKGKVTKAKEILIVGKTMNKNVQKIIKNVKKLHSYEVPCVIFFDIKNGNTDFLKWIIKSV